MTGTSSISSANPILLNDVIGNVIFRNLSLPALGACCRICKAWNKMARDHVNAFSHEKAFGPKEWHTYFGSHLRNVPRLPPNITEILSSPCPFWPGKKVFETHLLVFIPETINGQPLNLEYLDELVQQPLLGHETKYSSFYIVEDIHSAAHKSHWVLMTRDVIEDSRSQSFEDQQALMTSYSQKAKVFYEIPTRLDATVCILMEYIRTGTRLYANNPWTYTRCQEKYDANNQLGVGGFSDAGLYVDDIRGDTKSHGVGGVRKF